MHVVYGYVTIFQIKIMHHVMLVAFTACFLHNEQQKLRK